jgi:serpin B
VIHKAFIDVNETGTEAAAATAAVMVGAAMRAPDPTPPPEFRADHPFVYLIRDNRSGGILFMGRVNDPTK